jgi:membrane associated rhomboid family serine protease
MGAYLVLFPRVRVFTLIPLGFYMQSVALPAWAMLIYWTVLQLVGGIGSVFSEQGGGVAFWAHIGGFVAGIVLVKIFERRDRVLAHASHHWEPQGRWQ